ncbi:nitrogen fixation protein NifQ [Phaeovulum vinaykumarii]|uniref:Nitrogen fixation protein NifQ n=1 Tax=Phaeovulum vinaykumarii TaxID=407234 RepID=A0A1N7LKI6_9RHOB|nr:nitrogen fixation protein NifQ [Phaeovulum vinaykumarii]SIS74333.1 nitrogen fixation protein NifQ [Phaeovulum vinaykumarii]SOC04982.1 nitrogen fixation protein NifQ [Phaeovulum vinaykumarii]
MPEPAAPDPAAAAAAGAGAPLNPYAADPAADAADLAAIVAHARATMEPEGLAAALGLAPARLERLAVRWGLDLPDTGPGAGAPPAEEAHSIALLLMWRGGLMGEDTDAIAQILARRAQEPRHLWEDLGLPDRARLGRLIARHFPRLHAANVNNMRWKRFFYRQICGTGAARLCPAPNCEACPEKTACFAPDA